MGSWAQAKLSCGQEGSLGQAWGMEPGKEHRHNLGAGLGTALGEQEPSHLSGGSLVGGGCPVQEDFLLVSAVDREGMRSLSPEVSKQELAQERAVGLEG